MLRNYLRIAYRNLFKNKVFSFVNIFGLAVGMAAFLSILNYVSFERSYEAYNPNADNIYRITIDFYNGAEYIVTDCETHAPMGGILKDKIPEVEDYVRMFHNDGLQDIKVGEKKFLDEGIYFADPSAFKILSLDVLQGNSGKALTEPNQAVLTEAYAKKYFGRIDVVGETLDIDNHVYQISAVINDIPANTHLKFTTLLSHSTLKKINPWYNETEWMGNNEYTYLLMTPGTKLSDFNKKLSSLSASLKDKIRTNKYVAQPIRDIHLYSNKTYEPEVNGNAKVVYFLLVIAVFIIVIAWVNYINLSTARAMERAREVGIRKVMGSVKAQLVLQFLSESVMVNIMAGLLSLILFQATLPVFHELTGQPMIVSFMSDYSFWRLFFGLLVIGSLLSGLYPAFVLSSFQPVAVLKGKFQSSLHGQKLRKGLVIFQFGATVVLMVSMCIVYLQINYLRNYDLGMNLDQTLAIRVPQIDAADSLLRSTSKSLKTELLRNKDVQVVSRAGSLPGLSLHELSSTSFTRVGREKLDGQYEYYHFSIDEDFIGALGMKLITGRNFKDGMLNQDQVIINEEALHRLGFINAEDAIGTKITYQTRWPGEPATIIGVLHNFYQRSPKEKHIPMLFKYNEDTDYFALRLKTDNIQETMAAVKATWNRVYPNSVFHYFFLNEKYAQQFEADVQFGKVVATFSILAVFIACLGLFGLSSYTIVQRTKEIGIRKVLGASVGQIVRLLSEDFAKIIIVASLLALPIAYFAMNEWLSNYDARISMPMWVFVLPVIAIVGIALLTVSFQTIRTALSNPAESLKQE